MKDYRQFVDQGFGEVLGWYLYDKGVISSPYNVGQADLDLEGTISYVRRDGVGEVEYYTSKDHPMSMLFAAMKAFAAYKE